MFYPGEPIQHVIGIDRLVVNPIVNRIEGQLTDLSQPPQKVRPRPGLLAQLIGYCRARVPGTTTPIVFMLHRAVIRLGQQPGPPEFIVGLVGVNPP